MLSRAKDFATRRPAPAGKREQGIVRRIRHIHHQLGLEDWSDLELKAAIQKERAKSTCERPGRHSSEQTAKVFAIVNESINRRLGAWRIFDEDSERPGWSHSDQGVLDNLAGGVKLTDAEIIAREMAPARAAGQGRFGPDHLLAAEFYRAVRRLDTSGRCRFLPTDQQLLAGLHLLSSRVVEMPAGEGKTIAIAFAAVMQAVLGNRVHVHTANDYLAERDCRLLAPIYHSLGLTAGVILDPTDNVERRAAYGCDVVYGTVREFGFDYLRDNLVSKEDERVQPALPVALVDEADQALIDEGDTPLIIAGPPSQPVHPWRRVDDAVKELVAQQQALCREYAANLERLHPGDAEHGKLLCLALLAAPFAESLRRMALEHPRSYRRGLATLFPDGGDVADEALAADLFYLVDEGRRFVTPTEKGLDFLAQWLGDFCPTASSGQPYDDTNQAPSRKTARQLQLANQVYQSLRAHLLLERDRDYVVGDDSVVILDQHTGRTKPDNLYRHGLQAALEAKEGVTIRPDCETLAQVSVPGFVNLYRTISGITGTARASAAEFQRRYSLELVSVFPSHPVRRMELPAQIFDSERQKIAGVVAETRRCRQFGRPVLVGTQSIESSRIISEALHRADIEHRVLNAVTTDEEADIVRNAGRVGAVTVATNLAGRGTDIVLDPDLDRVVINRWLRWILEELRTGAGVLGVVCHSEEEAEILTGALEDRSELAVARRRQGGGCYFSISRSEQGPDLDETCKESSEWEFGLGLHVINAEFSRYPRVATQLKGRSGRQGMFGSGRQMISWEDLWLLPLARGKPALGRWQRQDSGALVFQESPRVERYISRRQDEAEREAAAARNVAGDYAAVSDAHASTYYQFRKQLLSGSDLDGHVRAAAQVCAGRLVHNHFPNLDAEDYTARFHSLVEEALCLYDIDLSPLAGEPLDKLPELVGQELLAKLEGIRLKLEAEALKSLAHSLLLDCADCCWRDHLTDLQQAVSCSAAGGHYHKAAVADYILHARDMWDDFQARLQETFCSRLLTFPLELLTEREGVLSRKEDDIQDLLSLVA
jgi:preprotein translocase subunit SecA